MAERVEFSRGDFRLTAERWNVAPNELVAVVGVNGAGKTTFMEILGGRQRCDRGEVFVRGIALARLGHRLPEVIGYVPDSLTALEELSVEEHCRLLSAAYECWDAEYADALGARLNVPLDRSLKTLSRGTRTKAGFILVEASRPRVLLLDEPTAGLDPVVRQELLDVLSDIVRSNVGRTVVFSTHLLEDLVPTATQVALVRRGVVLPCVGADDLTRPGGPDVRDPQSIARFFGVDSLQ